MLRPDGIDVIDLQPFLVVRLLQAGAVRRRRRRRWLRWLVQLRRAARRHA